MNNFTKCFVLLFALIVQSFTLASSASFDDKADLIRAIALTFRKTTDPVLLEVYPNQRQVIEDVLLGFCRDMQTHDGEALQLNIDHFGLVCIASHYMFSTECPHNAGYFQRLNDYFKDYYSDVLDFFVESLSFVVQEKYLRFNFQMTSVHQKFQLGINDLLEKLRTHTDQAAVIPSITDVEKILTSYPLFLQRYKLEAVEVALSWGGFLDDADTQHDGESKGIEAIDFSTLLNLFDCKKLAFSKMTDYLLLVNKKLCKMRDTYFPEPTHYPKSMHKVNIQTFNLKTLGMTPESAENAVLEMMRNILAPKQTLTLDSSFSHKLQAAQQFIAERECADVSKSVASALVDDEVPLGQVVEASSSGKKKKKKLKKKKKKKGAKTIEEKAKLDKSEEPQTDSDSEDDDEKEVDGAHIVMPEAAKNEEDDSIIVDAAVVAPFVPDSVDASIPGEVAIERAVNAAAAIDQDETNQYLFSDTFVPVHSPYLVLPFSHASKLFSVPPMPVTITDYSNMLTALLFIRPASPGSVIITDWDIFITETRLIRVQKDGSTSEEHIACLLGDEPLLLSLSISERMFAVLSGQVMNSNFVEAGTLVTHGAYYHANQGHYHCWFDMHADRDPVYSQLKVIQDELGRYFSQHSSHVLFSRFRQMNLAFKQRSYQYWQELLINNFESVSDPYQRFINYYQDRSFVYAQRYRYMLQTIESFNLLKRQIGLP